MSNAYPSHSVHEEAERDAYNGAFYELGLRWHWDAQTYRALVQRCHCASDRVRLYLESVQPHLLKAYDAEFLVAAIEARKATIGGRGDALRRPVPTGVNWAAIQGGEIGA